VTAYYVAEQLARHAVTVSRPAHGLPAGSDLEYADELTMARAFAGRRAL
jgi:recombination protein RecR